MNYLKNYIISLAIFFVVLSLLLIITSVIFAYTSINDRYIDSFILFSMAFSAFISSFFLGRKIKKKGIVHGVILNIVSVIIIFGISCILNHAFKITNTLGIYIGLCALTGIVGGILGVNV